MNGFTNFVNHSNKRAEEGGKCYGRETRKGMEKKGKEIERRKGESSLQDEVHGLGWGRICALLPGYTTASLMEIPRAGLPF